MICAGFLFLFVCFFRSAIHVVSWVVYVRLTGTLTNGHFVNEVVVLWWDFRSIRTHIRAILVFLVSLMLSFWWRWGVYLPGWVGNWVLSSCGLCCCRVPLAVCICVETWAYRSAPPAVIVLPWVWNQPPLVPRFDQCTRNKVIRFLWRPQSLVNGSPITKPGLGVRHALGTLRWLIMSALVRN